MSAPDERRSQAWAAFWTGILSDRRPFWWPSIRDIMSLAMLAFSIGIFLMIRENPDITENQGFMLLAQGVILTGLIGLVLAQHFQLQKAREDVQHAQAQTAKALDALANQTPATLPPGSASLTVTPPATVDVHAPPETPAAVEPGPAEDLLQPPPAR